MSHEFSGLTTQTSLLLTSPASISPVRITRTKSSFSTHNRLDGLLLVGNRALARALAGARVGPRALAAHGQTPAVPDPPVAADFHQTLDVHGDVLAEIALH